MPKFEKGLHPSVATEFKKGHKPWWIVRGLPHPGLGLFKKGHPFYYGEPGCRKGLPSHWKGQKLSRETVRKFLARRGMSSLEVKFNDILLKNNLPYKFVGDGKFFVERKNPDFVNVNGKKLAIEVYYRGHKERFRGDVETWKKERYDIFNEYGWDLLFFDETQVSEKNVLKVLRTYS